MDLSIQSDENVNIYQDLKICKTVQKITFMRQALFNLRSYKTMVRKNQAKQEGLKKYLQWVQLIISVLHFICVMDFRTYGPVIRLNDQQMKFQFENLYGFQDAEARPKSVQELSELLDQLLEKSLSINNHFFINIDTSKIVYEIRIH